MMQKKIKTWFVVKLVWLVRSSYAVFNTGLHMSNIRTEYWFLNKIYTVHIIFDRGCIRSTVDDSEKGTTIRPRVSLPQDYIRIYKREVVQATKDSLDKAHEKIETQFTAWVAAWKDVLRAYPCHSKRFVCFPPSFMTTTQGNYMCIRVCKMIVLCVKVEMDM